jgi:hypothetical protein
VSTAVVGLDFSGTTAYLASGKGILVYDVSSPGQPQLLRSYKTPSFPSGVAVSGDNLDVADRRGGFAVLQLSDLDPPQILITSPTLSGVYTNPTSSLNLGGSANDNQGLVQGTVTRVTWSNSRGEGGDASGTTSWLANGITLQPGTNVLTVAALDQAGNSGNSTLTVMYQPPKQDQTINFPSIANHPFGDGPIQLLAAASSGLPVHFSVVTGPATLADNVLTLTGADAVTV